MNVRGDGDSGADAAAVLFAVGKEVPALPMGGRVEGHTPQAPVNVWHWSADRQGQTAGSAQPPDGVRASDGGGPSYSFGPGGASPSHNAGGHIGDVNGDGFDDLVSHYPTQDSGLSSGDTEACVDGETTGGTPIHGCDAVNIDK